MKLQRRSPYAKALADRRYRQQIVQHLDDDDLWKEELEEYFNGKQELDPKEIPETDKDSTKDKHEVPPKDGGSNEILVDTGPGLRQERTKD